MIETHVYARNHSEAVESLKAEEGLSEVVSVQRADDEDDDCPHRHRFRKGWKGCVVPFLVTLLGAAAVVGYYWLRRH